MKPDSTLPPQDPPSGSPPSPSPSPQPANAGEALHRSGAVARMLRMPVATLRVWERRYGLTQPALSPSGQRLYSAEEVRRLALLKQLTDLGHAIGRLAALDMAQLQRVAATHAQTLADAQSLASAQSLAGAQSLASTPSPPPQGERTGASAEATALPAPPWRLAVIGLALGKRMQRPALLRRLGRPVQLLGPFVDAAHAAAQANANAQPDAQPHALLIHAPQLHEAWLAELHASAPALAALPTAVLYSFASDASCDALARAGATLLREPQPDAVLAQWLQPLAQASMAAAAAPASGAFGAAGLPGSAEVPPRRWDDAALADFAGLSSTIACECPRHLAELLMQLSHFEDYSAQCQHRSPADAELHAYLRHTAAAARARFELALERVAVQEGLILPASLGKG
jgi:DNA-binding transcriptional MerR regulator